MANDSSHRSSPFPKNQTLIYFFPYVFIKNFNIAERAFKNSIYLSCEFLELSVPYFAVKKPT
jgi:hypothetical protein